MEKVTFKEKVTFFIDQFDVQLMDPLRKYGKIFFKEAADEEKLRKRKNISIIIVNYNTLFLIAHLIYSIYDKIIYKDGRIRIIVVDNYSFDGSRDFLEILDKNGFIELIKLNKQKYHGPGLRIGIKAIETFERKYPEENKTGTILTLDSDTVILRQDIINDSMEALYAEDNIALLGELQYDDSTQKKDYPHPSCLFIKKEIYDLPHIRSFILSGCPATALAMSIRKGGWKILDFLFKANKYILHLGRGTLNKVKDYTLKDNFHYEWAIKGKAFYFPGTSDGDNIYKSELKIFLSNIKELIYPYNSYLNVLDNFKRKKKYFG